MEVRLRKALDVAVANVNFGACHQMNPSGYGRRANSLQVCLALTIASAITAGCSSSPSAQEMETALAKLVESQSEGCMKLVAFGKAAEEPVGSFWSKDRWYLVTFAAAVEFKRDCKWVRNAGFKTAATDAQAVALGVPTALLAANAGVDHKLRDRVEIASMIGFSRIDNQWQASAAFTRDVAK